MRYRSDAKAPGAHECLINFPKIADKFGELFATLREKREEYGPGIYLYLGTRRGVRMFIEHRFVNLIWGLEAFDRRSRGETPAPPKLAAKIQRILDQVDLKKDRDWLDVKLKNAGEPNLSERLFGIFSTLPIAFDIPALRKFCTDCADRRNDISHFGGIRHKGQRYNDFMREIDQKSTALAALYHLLLLTVIGVDKARLNFDTNNNWPLSRMRMDLQLVGVLADKRPPGAQEPQPKAGPKPAVPSK